MVKDWAFIYCCPEYNPDEHTVVIDNGLCKTRLIGIDINQREQCTEIATQLMKDGCQVIELCAGFGPIYIEKIKKATNYKIPVGVTMYGLDDCKAILEL